MLGWTSSGRNCKQHERLGERLAIGSKRQSSPCGRVIKAYSSSGGSGRPTRLVCAGTNCSPTSALMGSRSVGTVEVVGVVVAVVEVEGAAVGGTGVVAVGDGEVAVGDGEVVDIHRTTSIRSGEAMGKSVV